VGRAGDAGCEGAVSARRGGEQNADEHQHTNGDPDAESGPPTTVPSYEHTDQHADDWPDTNVYRYSNHHPYGITNLNAVQHTDEHQHADQHPDAISSPSAAVQGDEYADDDIYPDAHLNADSCPTVR
jgi:hypothetical protein